MEEGGSSGTELYKVEKDTDVEVQHSVDWLEVVIRQTLEEAVEVVRSAGHKSINLSLCWIM